MYVIRQPVDLENNNGHTVESISAPEGADIDYH